MENKTYLQLNDNDEIDEAMFEEMLESYSITRIIDKEDNAMTRERFLDEAKKCVCTDREGQYGAPEDNFSLIAAFWNEYLESKYPEIEYSSVIEASDVAMMMALLKVARIATGKPKADNYVDLIGYAACGGEIQCKEA